MFFDFFFVFFEIFEDGQIEAFKHSPHFGEIGLQICCPNPTSSKFISDQRSAGNHDSKPILVASGVEVSFGTHCNRLAIRWTWVSTPKYKIFLLIYESFTLSSYWKGKNLSKFMLSRVYVLMRTERECSMRK